MKVLLTHPPTDHDQPWEGAAFVRGVADRFRQSSDKRGHRLVDSDADADLILYLEPQAFRDRPYAELLLREDHIQRFPEKCFAYGYADCFIGFLPGIYVCLPAEHAANRRFASWNYILGFPNPFVGKLAAEKGSYKPSLLFSFRGTRSAPVREPIFRNAVAWSKFARITEVDGKLFHQIPTDLQVTYAEEILDSQFVLCPRGLGCSSHRLFETMALGRVPVILSDDWVEPEGPDWPAFSVRVPEKNATDLPQILRGYADRAPEMGNRARQEWKQWFSPDVAIPRFFDRLAALAAFQNCASLDYERLWRSWQFYVPYGLAPHQKLWRNLSDGTLLKKVSALSARL
jgi:hypothetical protein